MIATGEEKAHRWSGGGVEARRPEWVRAAFIVTLLFATLHLYWAVGGAWGLPPAALQYKGAARAANWVVTGILVAGACWVLVLNRRWARRIPSGVLLSPLWLGAVVCISHALFGLVTKGLYLGGYEGAVDFPTVAGVDAVTAAADNHRAAVLDVVAFEPFFLAQGLALALAGWQFIRGPRGRRLWTWSLGGGVVLVDGFGAALSLAGLHVAVG